MKGGGGPSRCVHLCQKIAGNRVGYKGLGVAAQRQEEHRPMLVRELLPVRCKRCERQELPRCGPRDVDAGPRDMAGGEVVWGVGWYGV